MPSVTPWPGFDVERTSVRVVLLDDRDHLLLFRTLDPTMPELGQWWELPGGGVENGESYAETAVREIAEETGFALIAADIAAPTWRRDATYARRHVRTWQHEVVVRARVRATAPVPAPDGRTDSELEEYVGHRWWAVADILAAREERFFPGRLPQHLPAFLRGEAVDEPFDHWN